MADDAKPTGTDWTQCIPLTDVADAAAGRPCRQRQRVVARHGQGTFSPVAAHCMQL